ncbi:N-acetylgalactosamine kinase [Armadillidium nasatum]|uniref:N-acetylgalactosamine kinase n=1 Tax=Armadillidium nasatum TaxID=96803 RepID=A0A5N5T485_9CRUS|nr:N-acetylgalactosamine kinase [Armadillidium nasatum]
MSIRIFSVPDKEPESLRFQNINNHFNAKFKTSPDFYARAPGRVNIIGEHIDYCGYAVFPMAIEQDVIIGVKERDDQKLCIENIDSNYENFECDIDQFVLSELKTTWYKYILCGMQGVLEDGKLTRNVKGLSLVVSGNIPPSAGLSSSSALVCAAALALCYCFESELSLHSLAELCAHAERYIGTEGGGMDQAASLLSKAGFAQLMEFNPLRCTPVSLPEGAVFVVANSLAEKNKAQGSEYNTRVTECRLACRLIAKRTGIKIPQAHSTGRTSEHARKYLF